MKAAALLALFYHPAAAALPQQNVNIDNYETIFLEANSPRRTPDNAPPNANQYAYAKRMNERDVILDRSPNVLDESNPQRRIKGVELLAEGIHHVILTPEQYQQDCKDVERMHRLGMDTSSCIHSGSGSGSKKMEQELDILSGEEQDSNHKLHSEQDYLNDLQLEKGETPLNDAATERRLNYDTGRTIDIGIFHPLECNLDTDGGSILPTGEECEASPDGMMSDLVAEAGDEAVVIPCGQCIKVRQQSNIF